MVLLFQKPFGSFYIYESLNKQSDAYGIIMFLRTERNMIKAIKVRF